MLHNEININSIPSNRAILRLKRKDNIPDKECACCGAKLEGDVVGSTWRNVVCIMYDCPNRCKAQWEYIEGNVQDFISYKQVLEDTEDV